jgi:hypothetical protein
MKLSSSSRPICSPSRTDVPRPAGRLLVVLLLAAMAAVSVANELHPTFLERADFRNADYFRLMRTFPGGSEVAGRYGSQTLVGVESRALSKWGAGVTASAEIWWASAHSRATTFIPLSAGAFYARPLLDGNVVPYAGVLGSYNFASMYYSEGDTTVSGAGSAAGGGLFFGVEVPLFEKFRVKGETRFSWCRVPVAFGGVRRAVDFSRTDVGIGLSMGLTDFCF